MAAKTEMVRAVVCTPHCTASTAICELAWERATALLPSMSTGTCLWQFTDGCVVAGHEFHLHCTVVQSAVMRCGDLLLQPLTSPPWSWLGAGAYYAEEADGMGLTRSDAAVQWLSKDLWGSHAVPDDPMACLVDSCVLAMAKVP